MTENAMQRSSLWKRSFAAAEERQEDRAAIERLRRALLDIREKVSHLASEIRRDLPGFTLHDIGHIDELWERASLVGGNLTLNPVEIFVFGVSALFHDLAMSSAAYKIVGTSIRSQEQWADCLASKLRDFNGRPPLPSELVNPPEHLAAAAEAELLRELHAEQAEILSSGKWQDFDGSTVYLIGDSDLRSAYGRLIGQLAASHHWSRDRLVRDLSTMVGGPPFCPSDWRIDPLVIGSLLRVADASHLDGSRAPAVLAAVEPLPTDSRHHWVFQSKLQRPYLNGDSLVFTAPAGFAYDEAEAWWLSFDMLKVVDDEIRGVNRLLSEQGRSPFPVNRVAGLESPASYSRLAPCVGWEPVDTKVQVSDVAALVRRLGGKELYGSEPSVAIRELLVNACDAVKARIALLAYRGGNSPVSARVLIRSTRLNDAWWLEVADNGIGMSREVLTGSLLDFGRSSWLSKEVVRENSGLLASKFEPTGRFGLGFFSVFMLGSQVRVISRAQTAGRESTAVLEFGEGLDGRPIIREGLSSELLDEPGTRVLVRLDDGVVDDTGNVLCRVSNSIRSGIQYKAFTGSLNQTVKYLLPAPEVDIWVQSQADAAPGLLMRGNDWMEIDGTSLMCRLFAGLDLIEDFRKEEPYGGLDYVVSHYGPRLEIVKSSSGVSLGRICASDDVGINYIGWTSPFASVVSAGPARTESGITGVVGLLIGQPLRAARDAAIPLLGAEFFADWSTSETLRVIEDRRNVRSGEWCNFFALSMGALGADLGAFPHWHVENEWLDDFALMEWLRSRDVVRVVHPLHRKVRIGEIDQEVAPLPDTVWFEGGGYRTLSNGPDDWPMGEGAAFFERRGLFYRILREAWLIPEEVQVGYDDVSESSPVSVYGDQTIYADAEVLRRSELLSAVGGGDSE